MKKFQFLSIITLIVFTLLTVNGVYAQVGIGTTSPNDDALLDVFSTTKGLLIPRVKLVTTDSSLPLSAHCAGMIVYNTGPNGAGANAVIPGFYYNDGTNWLKLLNGTDVDLTDDEWINGTYSYVPPAPDPPIDIGIVYLNKKSDGITDRTEEQKVYITDEGSLTIGKFEPSRPLEAIVVRASDADLDMYSFTEPGIDNLTVFHIHAAGGTVASPLPINTRTNEPNIFAIQAKGFDGVNYWIAASITVAVDGVGDTGSKDMPGKITFSTTPDGASQALERMVIKNTGNIGIGTKDPKVKFDVAGLIKTEGYTVTDLLNLTLVEGAIAYVTNSNVTPKYLQEVVSGHNGGVTKFPVFCDGKKWIYH